MDMTRLNNASSLTKKKYLIIFVCMFMQAIPFGVAQNIQPLFIPYVIKAFGFSLGSFSLIFTFGAMAAAICSPFLGKLFGKVNIKILFIVGTVLSSVGFLGFGFAKALPHFYFLSGISQVGCVLFSGLGVPYVINHWFPGKGRGKALGIAFSGGSIGNVFLQQITSHMLAEKGISYSYIFFGLLALLVSLPTILFFIRLPKADEEAHLETTKEEEPTKEEEEPVAHQVHPETAARKNKFFWSFCLGYGIMAISISALSTQYATYFTGELGMSPTLVGTLGSTFALFCLIGNIVGGGLFDRIGTFKTMEISLVLSSVAIISLMLAKQVHALAFFFSVAYGLNVYSYMSAPAFMAVDVFGKKDSSVNLGIISLSFALGFALGSTLFGAIVDRFNFEVGWGAMLVAVLVGYTLLLFSINRVKKHVKDHIEDQVDDLLNPGK